MTSIYYSKPAAVPPASLARSADVNSIASAVDAAFSSIYPDLQGAESLKTTYPSLAARLNDFGNQLVAKGSFPSLLERLDNIDFRISAMAGFRGPWSVLTGPLNMPASAYHLGKNWILISNITDVAAHVPGTSSVWAESHLSISTFDQEVNAQGNILKNMVLQFTSEKVQNLGTITVNTAINLTNGNMMSATIGAALTLSFTGWPLAGYHGELLLELTNAGAYAIVWPTINWIMGDGSTTTVISSLLPLRTSGKDFIFLWTRDAGTTIYGKIVR